MSTFSPCRVCNSPYSIFLHHVVGQRSGGEFSEYVCLDCRSFFHTSGYQEDDSRKASDFNALRREHDNHDAIQAELALELLTKLPSAKTMLEVGHGTGLLLKAFRDYGITGKGFEVNEYCHKFAREQLDVDSIHGLLDATHTGRYDLIVGLQVFEHLEDPRALFKIMRGCLNESGAIYISVPFVERMHWPFLSLSVDNGRSPFSDNDVHITHFSIEGMKRMGLGLGARTADFFVSKDVYQHSPGAYQGVLFSF